MTTYDGEGDSLDVATIETVDVGSATITLAGVEKPVRLRWFRDGAFIDTRPGAPLASAVAASRTPAELQDEAEQLAVRRAGCVPGKLASGEARRAVLALVALEAAGSVPHEAQRAAFYAAVRRGDDAGTGRAAARLLGRVVQRFEALGSVPEDVYWRWAVLLRQAGEWQAAVRVACVLYSRPGLKEKTQLYLASTMAASLLDLAGTRPTSMELSEAERALKIGWALDPGDEKLWRMRRTLDGLRGNDGGKR